MTDTLRCRCGKEVGIVRLNGRILALGHKQNPGPKHHVVRLAPASRPGHEALKPLDPGPTGSHGRTEVPGGLDGSGSTPGTSTYPRSTQRSKGNESTGALQPSSETRPAFDPHPGEWPRSAAGGASPMTAGEPSGRRGR